MDKQKYGYIYIRFYESYELYNSCKLGKCVNIPSREGTYKTNEIKKGYFKIVIEVNSYNLDSLENTLKNHFINFNTYFNSGTEFYKKDIINLIIPYIDTLGIFYRVLEQEEIENLCRTVYLTKNIISPNISQQEVLDKITYFYQNNSIGRIIWVCGLGKALLGIFIVKTLNVNKVVIGVPSLYLQKQMISEILKIFPDISMLDTLL